MWKPIAALDLDWLSRSRTDQFTCDQLLMWKQEKFFVLIPCTHAQMYFLHKLFLHTTVHEHPEHKKRKVLQDELSDTIQHEPV